MNTKPQTANASSEATFAVSELLDRCMGNASIAVLVLDKFEKQLQADVAQIEQQLAGKDASGIASCAHALKGAAGAVAAGAIQRLAVAIEGHARANQLDKIASEIRSLRGEMERCLGDIPAARKAISPKEEGVVTKSEGKP